MIDPVLPGVGQRLPCFAVPNATEALLARLRPDLPNKEFVDFAMDLVEEAYSNHRTLQYDVYQKLTNGLLY